MEHITPDVTLVTGIVDLGRAALTNGFGRPFNFYRENFQTLLSLDVPMVIYADPSFEMPKSRSARKLVPTNRSTLEWFPYFAQIQRIRELPAWRSGAAWLASSPQAALAHYNPLIMSKLIWLAEQARANPFGTRHFAWIDGGITYLVPLDLLQRSLASAAMLRALRKFLLICFPYKAVDEVHGFEHGALAHYAGVPTIEWVARGGFFGGSAEFVLQAVDLYDAMLHDTLEHGYMGTEESIFTILANLHPELFDRFFIERGRMVASFFAHVDGQPTFGESARNAHGDFQ
jgi:hypothetical protein